MERCGWVGDDPLYQAYHDFEWGVPERDGRALWEQLMLEGFQAGLSWITILRKRDDFRVAFAGFVPEVLVDWGPAEVDDLLKNPGIVRHRGKVEATLGNARAYLEMGGGTAFSNLVWGFVDGVPFQGQRTDLSEVPAQTETSKSLSRSLKAAGFRFCGPTTCYAFMQAAGLVNDHVTVCGCHDRVASLGDPRAPGRE
ncbi:MAG: DNA-3-methyladenine glycosylase I [Pseudomonadota bacterium]